MHQPTLAWIVPVDSPGGGRPEHPIHYPPGIWGPTDPRPGWGLPKPEPPVIIWGGGNTPFPAPPIYLPPQTPGQPPVIIWGPPGPWPTPPIHIPIVPAPPGIWGPYPGFPTPPIHLPPSHIIWGGANEPFPTPPIYLPPAGPGRPPLIIWGPPGPWPSPPIYIPVQPPHIWGGGNVPFPTPPIHIPPGGSGPQPPDLGEPPTEVPANGVWEEAYVPDYRSWVWAYVEPKR